MTGFSRPLKMSTVTLRVVIASSRRVDFGSAAGRRKIGNGTAKDYAMANIRRA
jgi:hypothetical protein